jgi:hypothetical protein
MGALVFQGSPAGPLALRINNAAALGDTTLVAAVAGQKTRVYGVRLNAAAPTTVQLKDGAGTVLEVFNLVAGVPYILELREQPYYTGSVNTAFILNSSLAVQVDGELEYFTAV